MLALSRGETSPEQVLQQTSDQYDLNNTQPVPQVGVPPAGSPGVAQPTQSPATPSGGSYADMFNAIQQAKQKVLERGQLANNLSAAGTLMGTTAGHYMLRQVPKPTEVFDAKSALEAANVSQVQLKDLYERDPNSDRSVKAREFFKATYPDWTKNVPNFDKMSGTDLAMAAPHLKAAEERAFREQESNANRDLRQSAMDTNNALREKAMKETETNRKQEQERQDIRLGRLPSDVSKEISQKKDALDAINRIQQAFNSNKGEVGPIAGRVNNLLGAWGGSGPEVANLQAELRGALATYGKSISGSAISEPEMKRFETQLPQMVNRGDTFQTLLNRFKTQTEGSYNNLLDTFEKQGHAVKDLRLQGYQPGGASSAGGTIKIKMLKGSFQGQEKDVPTSDAQQLIDSGVAAKA